MAIPLLAPTAIPPRTASSGRRPASPPPPPVSAGLGSTIGETGSWHSTLIQPPKVYFVAGGVGWFLVLILSIVLFAIGPDTKVTDNGSTTEGVTGGVGEDTDGGAGEDPDEDTGEDPDDDTGEDPVEDTGEDPERPTFNPTEISEIYDPAVVEINCLGIDGKPRGGGSGFFIDAQGGVITNAHVVLGDGVAYIQVVRMDGRNDIVGRVEAINEDYKKGIDLAYLKVPGPVENYIEMNTDLPKKGQAVFVIGNKLGFERSIDDGIISGLRPGPDEHVLIQTNAPMGPGSSGGPLLNDKGKLIGVATFGYDEAQNLNFAMPPSAILELIEKAPNAKVLIGVLNGI